MQRPKEPTITPIKVIKEKKTPLVAPPKKTIEKPISPSKKEPVELKKQTPVESSVVKKKIDIFDKEKPFVYSKPKLEINQIMEKQKKIDIYAEPKSLTPKQEEWKVDYGVGIEKAGQEKLDAGGPLQTEMINGKVEFSKSF